jgi:CDP-glycerol glycerophosphotransferase (TagB/SpsB family)
MGVFLVPQRGRIEAKYRARGYRVTRGVSPFDAVVCGDTLKHPARYGNALLCNVDHGPCFKTLRYRNLLKQPATKYVVFAEGRYRMEKLREHGLDKTEIVRDVGLPKLDPFFCGRYSRDEVVRRHALDPEKRIVLYAPTYKPTSIFIVGEYLRSLLDHYTVVVKLHPYSWSGKYAPHAQHRLFERIAHDDARLCLVPPHYHDIMPYLFAADTMISEASSVINEFLALGRCGIIVDLDDGALKHSDGEPLLEEKTSEWLKDSFVHISDPSRLAWAVDEALHPSPERARNLKTDKDYIYSFTDGTSSLRVKQVIEELLGAREDGSSAARARANEDTAA